MSKFKTTLPQEGRTFGIGSSESLSENSGCPKDSGGDKNSIKNIMEEHGINPFTRRNSLNRTPPKTIASLTPEKTQRPYKDNALTTPRDPTLATRVSSMDKDRKIIKDGGKDNGRHAPQGTLEVSAEIKRLQALERIEQLTNELHEFVQPRINVHKEIKTRIIVITTAIKKFKTLDQEWRELQQHPLCHTPISTAPALPQVQRTTDAVTMTETDTGAEGDGESVAEDHIESNSKSGKRKDRSPPDQGMNRVAKKKDQKKSPSKEAAVESDEDKTGMAWKRVQSKKELRRQRKEQLSNQPIKGTRPEPKRKKPRKWTRPDAIIVRPVEKEKYADILRRIKTDVKDDQASSVEKISKTQSGNMLITISRKSTDKGQALQRAIAGILKEDAEVICKGPQQIVEIHDADDITTKDDILAALKREVGDVGEILLDAIKIRKAYRGTQIATVKLPEATAQKLLDGNSKIRIGWVNCRIKVTQRPIQCFKCWHFGHYGFQCQSKENRFNLCIRCGQEGHKIADCKNQAKCALCAENQSTEKAAHIAGNYKCPIFREALQRMTNKRI